MRAGGGGGDMTYTHGFAASRVWLGAGGGLAELGTRLSRDKKMFHLLGGQISAFRHLRHEVLVDLAHPFVHYKPLLRRKLLSKMAKKNSRDDHNDTRKRKTRSERYVGQVAAWNGDQQLSQ